MPRFPLLFLLCAIPVFVQAAVTAPAVEAPITRSHQISLNGKTLKYTSTTGLMPIRNAAGETEAQMFYMAYTLDDVPDVSKRRLMFSFNGGPGSASIWLHMGALGPKRVKMMDDGNLPPPPFQLEVNPGSLLPEADLVFIDPVGTGYSRAAKPELGKKFFGVQGDTESVGEFIRLYLTRNSRWTSPLFLIGESYGTTRAASLAGHLVDRGIALNGIALVSTILNFQTVSFFRGNDLGYALFLPTYTATAWYHKRLPADLQKDRAKALKESESWAMADYAEVLAKGDKLPAAERKAAADKLARLTGLSASFVEQNDLRVDLQGFRRELLRDKGVLVGRLDSRLVGAAPRRGTDGSDYDPSNTAIRPPYTAAFAQYVRAELGYATDQTYYVLGGGIGTWDWNTQNNYVDVTDSLRSALVKNPHMKLYVGYGYYDFATPYFAAQYTLSHMGVPAGSGERIREHYYDAGHMYYIHVESLRAMKKDVAAFLDWAAPGL